MAFSPMLRLATGLGIDCLGIGAYGNRKPVILVSREKCSEEFLRLHC